MQFSNDQGLFVLCRTDQASLKNQGLTKYLWNCSLNRPILDAYILRLEHDAPVASRSRKYFVSDRGSILLFICNTTKI